MSELYTVEEETVLNALSGLAEKAKTFGLNTDRSDAVRYGIARAMGAIVEHAAERKNGAAKPVELTQSEWNAELDKL